MLWLQRRPGETIVIDGRITIQVERFGKVGVKLGFSAPPDVRILRGELAGNAAEEPRPAEAACEVEPPRAA